MRKTIMISGGFDPLHVGHLRLIKAAKHYGHVIVALNSDEWLIRKKGYYFQTWADRAAILHELGVDAVAVKDHDDTVCTAIETLEPDFFGNGGDRTYKNTPELELCERIGVKAVFGLGGSKTNSSSKLVRMKQDRKWGSFEVLYDGDFKVKILTLLPGKGISQQKHEHRAEHWIFPENDNYRFVPKGCEHTLTNKSDEPVLIVEVQTGEILAEDDIERLDEHPEIPEAGRPAGSN